MIYVTRREVFSASHRIYNPRLSDEENFELYGKCSNPNGHGHNYELEVTIAGEINPETGYLIDLSELKNIIRKNINKNLNIDVEFLKGKIPTAENILISIWEQLKDKIPNGRLYSIKLYETENNYVEFRGE